MSTILQQGETAFGNTYGHIIQIPNHHIRKYDINIIYKLLNETSIVKNQDICDIFYPQFLKRDFTICYKFK